MKSASAPIFPAVERGDSNQSINSKSINREGQHQGSVRTPLVHSSSSVTFQPTGSSSSSSSSSSSAAVSVSVKKAPRATRSQVLLRQLNKPDSSLYTQPLTNPSLKAQRSNIVEKMRLKEATTSKMITRDDFAVEEHNQGPPLSPKSAKLRQILEDRDPDFRVEEWLQLHGKMIKRKMDANSRVRYRLVFDLLDSNNQGHIEFEELYEALRSTGLKMTATELGFMVSKIGHDGTAISFEDFVNGFASISEWDAILDLRKQRIATGKHNSAEPPLPFILWIPAFHRTQMLEAVMSLKGLKKNKSSALANLGNKTRGSHDSSLVGRWYEILRDVRGDAEQSFVDDDVIIDFHKEAASVADRHSIMSELMGRTSTQEPAT